VAEKIRNLEMGAGVPFLLLLCSLSTASGEDFPLS
jgi:hypothetical protein